MTPNAVRKSLLEEPHLAKELRLNDGTKILVRNREQWLASAESLIVLVGRWPSFIAYRNIMMVRLLESSGRRRKAQ